MTRNSFVALKNRQAYSKRLNGSVGKCLTTVGAKLYGVVKIGYEDMEEACSPLGADRIHFKFYDRFVPDNEPPDFFFNFLRFC